MARTPRTLPEALPPAEHQDQEAIAAAAIAVQAASLSHAETDEVFAAGMDIGRLQAMDFITTIGNSAMLSIYENLKKSKGWRHLRNPESSDGRNFENLQDFCKIKLGRSYQRMQELCANRNLVGQEAFEQAEKIGLRQVDYNAIRALPAPKQALLQEALAEGADKETITAALRELAAQDQREIEALQGRAAAAEKELAENTALLAAKNKTIDKLQTQVQRVKSADPDVVRMDLLDALQHQGAAALGTLRGQFRQVLLALAEFERAGGTAHREVAGGWIDQLEAELEEQRLEFGLLRRPPVPGTERPVFADE